MRRVCLLLVWVFLIGLLPELAAQEFQRVSDGEVIGKLQNDPPPTPKPRKRFRLVDFWQDSSSDSLTEGLADDFFGDLYGGATMWILSSLGMVTLSAATAYTSVSFCDEMLVPSWRAEINSIWYFESRMQRELASGAQFANSKAFDWQGSPGFQARLTHQTFYRLGTELVFDYLNDQKYRVFDGISELSTVPGVAIPSSSIAGSRRSGLVGGQINFLLRNNPSVFPFAGFRWWHQHDDLTMQTLVPQVRWQTATRLDAPLIQLGIQYGNLGQRWSWRNRFLIGMGPSFGRTRIETDGIMGAFDRFGSDTTKFAALAEMRSEVEYSIHHWLSLHAGAQLTGFTAALRPANQIDYSNLNLGLTGQRVDSALYSGLYFGLTAQH